MDMLLILCAIPIQVFINDKISSPRKIYYLEIGLKLIYI